MTNDEKMAFSYCVISVSQFLIKYSKTVFSFIHILPLADCEKKILC